VYLRADYELYERLIGYLGIAVIVAAIAMLVAYVLSRQPSTYFTSPLLAIAAVAREVTEKRTFSLRAPKLSKDEIRHARGELQHDARRNRARDPGPRGVERSSRPAKSRSITAPSRKSSG